MEGKGVAAEQSPSPGIERIDRVDQIERLERMETRPTHADAAGAADMVNSMEAPEDEGEASGGEGESVPDRDTDSAPGRSGRDAWQQSRARVDARLLEATLLNLRKRIAAIPLVFDIPGADEVSAERARLLSQIDDYLLPRLRQSAAPILVALVGSTGAGKSTLVNSIVGTQVSLTGVRRPTTNSPVLACHPDDIGWFAENMFLPTLPRVRQEGLARPGQDGLLVLAASEGMTKGVALLDTPDIDSVVRAHYDFAYQFLDASDLWLFMTSASRYADAPVWEVLQHARERGATLGVILSRVPPSHRTELVAHFNAMLDANGITAENRFVIPEAGIVDGMLPVDIFQPIRDWLTETAQHADRRVAVLSQTMAGVLDTFKVRVPKLAAHVDAQVTVRTRLYREAEAVYANALEDFTAGIRNAQLLRGEVLARWQDYAGSGDLGAALRGKRGAPQAKGRRARKGAGTPRPAALDTALRTALQALVVSVADRAAEQVARIWRADPAGATLLALAEASRARGELVKREFDDAFGTSSPDQAAKQATFDRASSDLSPRVTRAVSAWQDQLVRLLQAEKMPKGGSGQDSEALSFVTLVAMLGDPGDQAHRAYPGRPAGAQQPEEIVTVPMELLASAFGAAAARQLIDKARQDLAERVRLLFDEELLRFAGILDQAGPVHPVAAVRLYQAEYSLEAAR